jgi:hypothetical protein
MNTQRSMEERLWDYIDGVTPAAEKTVIEGLLEKDASWKATYQELLQTHEWLQSSELDQPSMRFTKNVMEEIAKLHIAPATKTYINKKVIWGIGSFFMVLILGFLVYGFAQMEWTVSSDNSVLQNVNKLDLSKFFSNTWVNVFMMVNVVVGLFLLDNYLSSRRKLMRKEHL